MRIIPDFVLPSWPGVIGRTRRFAARSGLWLQLLLLLCCCAYKQRICAITRVNAFAERFVG